MFTRSHFDLINVRAATKKQFVLAAAGARNRTRAGYPEGVMPNPTPHAAITFNRETGKFGFCFWMPGKRPHYSTETFPSADDVRNWVDPHGEREWETPESGAVGIVAISRGYREGPVPARLLEPLKTQ